MHRRSWERSSDAFYSFCGDAEGVRQSKRENSNIIYVRGVDSFIHLRGVQAY